jgi:integrase
VCDRHLRAVRDNNGPSTAKATRSVLSGICRFAARYDALERNPVRDTGKISAKPKKVPTALTIAAVKSLRAALLGTQRTVDRDLPDFVDMMLATGLRIGECSAITWGCVDLDAGTVDVRGIVIRVRGQGLVIRRDESSKLTERTLDLPSWAVEMLRKRKSRLTPKQLREVDVPVFLLRRSEGSGIHPTHRPTFERHSWTRGCLV